MLALDIHDFYLKLQSYQNRAAINHRPTQTKLQMAARTILVWFFSPFKGFNKDTHFFERYLLFKHATEIKTQWTRCIYLQICLKETAKFWIEQAAQLILNAYRNSHTPI